MKCNVLNSIKVVLVEPQNPINVGNVMRAMKNMGLQKLALVHPAPMALEKTQISAHRTQDMLDNIEICTNIDEALHGIHASYGFSARERSQNWISLPLRNAVKEAIEEIHNHDVKIAFLFGREQTGLTNAELERCSKHVRIPTTEYASLNLSQAVMCAAYELASQLNENQNILCNTKNDPNNKKIDKKATADQNIILLKMVANALSTIGFYKSNNSTAVIHKLHAILKRSEITENEFHLLMGACREIFNYANLVKRGITPEIITPDAQFTFPDNMFIEE